jgi:hypothetical protein
MFFFGSLIYCRGLKEKFKMIRKAQFYQASVALIHSRRGFVSSRTLLSSDPAEIAREQNLRSQIREKYKGMRLPEMTNFEYGKFASKGILQDAASKANQASAEKFKQFVGGNTGGNNNSGSSSDSNNTGGASGGTTSNSQNETPAQAQPVDWLMMLSGTALVIVSTRLLSDRLGGPKNDENYIVPIWCVSFDQQAKYLLFLVSVDKFVKDQLQQEFERVRVSYPFLNFFDWLESRYPAYGAGRKYSKQMAVEMVSQLLAQGGRMQLAALGRATSYAISRAGGVDPSGKVDEYLDQLESTSGFKAKPPMYGGQTPSPFFGGQVAPAPFYSSYTPPQAAYQPTNVQYDPAMTGGFQRPHSSQMTSAQSAYAHGAQDISLNDVLSSVQGRGDVMPTNDPRVQAALNAPVSSSTVVRVN